jgi:hypothetical protein
MKTAKENVGNFIILGILVFCIVIAGRTTEGSKRVIKKPEAKTTSYKKSTEISVFAPWNKQLPQK